MVNPHQTAVELITQRSKVQILPPQPIESIGCKPTGALPKTTIATEAGLRTSVVGLSAGFNIISTTLPFAVRHCPAINIHRRLNAGTRFHDYRGPLPRYDPRSR